MFREIGPIKPFDESYGIYPTTTMKYSFNIDPLGNLTIKSQVTSYPHKTNPTPHDWVTEVQIKDNIKIPNEMMSLIQALLKEEKGYFISHWTFVIRMIKKIKIKSSEIYKNVYLHTTALMEQVELLTAQKEQLMRRLRMHEPNNI
jgi:hypothetical protein